MHCQNIFELSTKFSFHCSFFLNDTYSSSQITDNKKNKGTMQKIQTNTRLDQINLLLQAQFRHFVCFFRQTIEEQIQNNGSQTTHDDPIACKHLNGFRHLTE